MTFKEFSCVNKKHYWIGRITHKINVSDYQNE